MEGFIELPLSPATEKEAPRFVIINREAVYSILEAPDGTTLVTLGNNQCFTIPLPLGVVLDFIRLGYTTNPEFD